MVKPMGNVELSPFDHALSFVLAREGGYVNHPNDPGGATNLGITQRTYNRWRRNRGQEIASVRDIKLGEVEAIYRQDYWLASGCDKDPWPLSVVVFDTAVNMGRGRAATFRRISKLNIPTYLTLRLLRYHERITKEHPPSASFAKGWANRIRHLADYLHLPWADDTPEMSDLRAAYTRLRALGNRS